MRFKHLEIPGPVLIEIEARGDERGFFARSFCDVEFAAAGLPTRFVQHNISFNYRRGTVRGMHFQSAPYEEPKLVRCTAGAIHDVALDLRSGSTTFGRSVAVRLSEENHAALYIPAGFAHGFQTLEDDTEVFYAMATEYVAAAAGGVRWNDPAFNLCWPLPVSVISERDLSYSDWGGPGA
jgi:dTDP-4-dehydrorhamnose 3,5-epimerase